MWGTAAVRAESGEGAPPEAGKNEVVIAKAKKDKISNFIQTPALPTSPDPRRPGKKGAPHLAEMWVSAALRVEVRWSIPDRVT